jgi:hypothetical protein
MLSRNTPRISSNSSIPGRIRNPAMLGIPIATIDVPAGRTVLGTMSNKA